MKIQQLELTNFRCFDHKTFEFSDQFNVLIGDNGTGKTTILDALSLLIGRFITVFSQIPKQNIFGKESKIQLEDKDIRQVRNNKIEYKLPARISCKSVINDIEIEYSDSLIDRWPNSYRHQTSPNIIDLANFLNQQISLQIIDFPLVAYYGTGRLWTIRKHFEEWHKIKNSVANEWRFLGYINCLNLRANLILDWLASEDIKILASQASHTIHQAISNALSTCQIYNWIEMNYDYNEDTLLVKSSNGNSQHFTKLSDGIKNMLGMVADIAYRAVVLNPHLGADAPKLTSGIVLIDEIDLHLHPKWQRRVVEDLKRTFPKIQFFATTHSEHIIQSLRDGELIDLNNPDSVPAAEYENKSIEDIAENVMHVPHPYRSERYQKMMETAERYYQMLEDSQNSSPEELQKLKTKLDELIEPYSDDVAYHAFLKMKRIAALGE